MTLAIIYLLLTIATMTYIVSKLPETEEQKEQRQFYEKEVEDFLKGQGS